MHILYILSVCFLVVGYIFISYFILKNMEKLQILNTREIKRIKQLLGAEFGYALEEEYAYLQNQKGRIFIITKEIAALDFAALRIDKMGLYFAESKDNQLRLSK